MNRKTAIHGMTVIVTFGMWGLASTTYQRVAEQAKTSNWRAVQGVVERSGVGMTTSIKGFPSYSADVVYRYVFNGLQYESSTVTMGAMVADETGVEAQQLAASLPVGLRLPVYVDPHDPRRSVLTQGLQNSEWRSIGFGVMLLAVPLPLWGWSLATIARRSQGRVGGVRVLEPAAGVSVVRNCGITPLGASGLTWSVVHFAWMGVSISLLTTNAKASTLAGIGLATVAAAAAGLLRKRWIDAGRCDTVFNAADGVVIPARGAKMARIIPATDITGWFMQDVQGEKEVFAWDAQVIEAGSGTPITVARVRTPADRDAFAAWLNGVLKRTGALGDNNGED